MIALLFPRDALFDFVFQRRRSAEDELTMREYLQEGDLISVIQISVFKSFISYP